MLAIDTIKTFPTALDTQRPVAAQLPFPAWIRPVARYKPATITGSVDSRFMIFFRIGDGLSE